MIICEFKLPCEQNEETVVCLKIYLLICGHCFQKDLNHAIAKLEYAKKVLLVEQL